MNEKKKNPTKPIKTKQLVSFTSLKALIGKKRGDERIPEHEICQYLNMFK